MKNIVKKNYNYKFIIGLIVGLLISATLVYGAEQIISSNDISYNNVASHTTSDNVQGAIDELYKKANKSNVPKPNNTNILKVYYYNQQKGSEDFCVTGDEETCKINTCYLNKAKDSCPAGTIIEYKVNDSDTIRFHVVHDDGEKLTLQSQKNTIYNIAWYATGNEQIENNTCRDCDSSKGPLTALDKLEKSTENWNNVNDLKYSIGDDTSTLGYSKCGYNESEDIYYNCSKGYTLDKINVRARMITLQELMELGCSRKEASCPIFLYNYTQFCSSHGGTIDDKIDNGLNGGYWTMTILSSVSSVNVFWQGVLSTNMITKSDFGARAVVEINK